MNKKNQNPKVVDYFANRLRIAFSSQKVLVLSFSQFRLFGEGVEDKAQKMMFGESPLKHAKKYDLIIGDLPFGMLRESWRDTSRAIDIHVRKNWVLLFQSLYCLKEEGNALYVVEPALGSEEWRKFETDLSESGFYVNAVFNTPRGICLPITPLQPNLILIGMSRAEKLFVGELDVADNVDILLSNFINGLSANSLETGVWVDRGTFRGFGNYKINKEISVLETQYKDYKKFKIKDIASEMNLGQSKKIFEDKHNSLYLPKVGNSPAFSKLAELKIKQQNYIQLVLDARVVASEYLVQFFRSALGQLTIRTLMSGNVIPQISKKDLEEAEVPIPSLDEQQLLSITGRKLGELKEKIENFNNELALNPKSAHDLQSKLDNMLASLEELSESDKIKAVIRKGESKTTEFKQTLSLDIKTGQKEKFIQLMVLKTLVAFLNTNGGVLLVGVSDDSRIVGVDNEIEKLYKDDDGYLKHVKNIVKTTIGEAFYPYIDYSLIAVDGLKVLCFECKASEAPCYLEEKDFYVRSNPATDKLEGPKMVDYIHRRFKK